MLFIVLSLMLLPLGITAQEPTSTPVITNWIQALDWSPDGTKIAIAYQNGKLEIRDAVTNQVTMTLKNITNEPLYNLDWSPDGNKIAVGGFTKLVEIWDVPTGTLLNSFSGHEDSIGSVNWSPDSTKIVTTDIYGYSGNFRVWDVENEQPLLAIDDEFIYEAKWSPDGTKLVSVGGLAVVIRDANTGVELARLKEHEDEVLSGDWSANGSKLASASIDGVIIIWDTVTNQSLNSFPPYTPEIASINKIIWHPNGNQVATADYDGSVRLWDITTGQVTSTFPATGAVFTIAYSPDGTKLVYGDESGILKIVSVPNPACQTATTIAAGDTIGLINAINTANSTSGADTICLAQDSTYTFSLVHSGLNALPNITSDIKIIGNRATLAQQAGSPAFRFFEVASNGTLTLENLTLSGAEANAWVTYEDDDLALRSAHTGLISKMLRLALP